MPSDRQSVQTSTYSPGSAASVGDARFALGGRQQPGHRLDPHLGRQRLAELARHIVGGVDEPAEDDRLEAVLEQRLDLADGALELEVGIGGEASARRANSSSLRRVLSALFSVSEPGLKSRATTSSASSWSSTVRRPTSSTSSSSA